MSSLLGTDNSWAGSNKANSIVIDDLPLDEDAGAGVNASRNELSLITNPQQELPPKQQQQQQQQQELAPARAAKKSVSIASDSNADNCANNMSIGVGNEESCHGKALLDIDKSQDLTMKRVTTLEPIVGGGLIVEPLARNGTSVTSLAADKKNGVQGTLQVTEMTAKLVHEKKKSRITVGVDLNGPTSPTSTEGMDNRLVSSTLRQWRSTRNISSANKSHGISPDLSEGSEVSYYSPRQQHGASLSGILVDSVTSPGGAHRLADHERFPYLVDDESGFSCLPPHVVDIFASDSDFDGIGSSSVMTCHGRRHQRCQHPHTHKFNGYTSNGRSEHDALHTAHFGGCTAAYMRQYFAYLWDADGKSDTRPNYLSDLGEVVFAPPAFTMGIEGGRRRCIGPHIQEHVTVDMRHCLVDWLVDICDEFKLSSSCLFLCVNLLDRVLDVLVVQRERLQLLGCVVS